MDFQGLNTKGVEILWTNLFPRNLGDSSSLNLLSTMPNIVDNPSLNSFHEDDNSSTQVSNKQLGNIDKQLEIIQHL